MATRTRPTRLLLADTELARRKGLARRLGASEAIEVVGEASSGPEALSLALALTPDVVLARPDLPLLNGATITRRLRDLSPAVRVVAVVDREDDAGVAPMVEAGATDYWVSDSPLWHLERAIAGAADPLVRLAQGLARLANRSGIAGFAAQEISDVTGASLSVVYIGSGEGRLVLAASSTAAPLLETPPEIVLNAFARGTLVALDDPDPALGACADAVAVPLVADGDTLGVLLVGFPAEARVDRTALGAAADLIAAALVAERRVTMTIAEARIDPLTGLPNRRAFEQHLENAVNTARERERAVSVALFDLDDFKQVNDRHGHLVGDRVLAEFGRIVVRNLRAGEQGYRIGGEEFAVVTDGGPVGAERVAERIRDALVRQRRGPRLPTVSAGVAGFPADASSKEELLHKADISLYAAKRSGRNRVVVHGHGVEITPQPAPRGRRTIQVAEPGDLIGGARDQLRVLVVDDDDGLRLLLRTTLDGIGADVREAVDAATAVDAILAAPPDVIVLDVNLPGMDGLSFCRRLKSDPATRGIGVVLLTGSDSSTEEAGRAVGAEAFLRKPFSPLGLVAVVEEVAQGLYEGALHAPPAIGSDAQVMLYARDLRRLLEVERGQRTLLQKAYRETMSALAAALDSKDVGTGAHSQRVQRYAVELASAVEPRLLDDPSIEYGFLLHDVGKIGIPDRILQKAGPLTASERRLMRTHTILGDQMLGGVALLQGEGLRVVRSHHERWDGRGYPDGLARDRIPLGARVFAVADALDAITSDRPYRPGAAWDEATAEIRRQAKRQFDPDVVEAFVQREPKLRKIQRELAAA
jgi:diguanylate cyclase (GGDEF)-like protein